MNQIEPAFIYMKQSEPLTTTLQRLLPYGTVTALAKQFGISTSAVSKALKIGRPGNQVVQAAVRIAEENGALSTAQALAKLTPA